MIDREKTIRDLETIGAWHTHHYEPFHYECAETIHNALELLKEQEPVKPRFVDGKRNHFIKCGKCNLDLMSNMKFCPRCGKEIKWND